MKILIVVEAPGKIQRLSQLFKALRIPVDSVLATVGQIADNPKSLVPIALSERLVETRYQIRDERKALVDKIYRAAERVDRVYLAMDDDQEGNVIAFDVAKALNQLPAELVRMRLRGMSLAEVRAAFDQAAPANLAAEAAKGMCRRIVDRAIGASCSQLTPDSMIPVGRVQSGLLIDIGANPLPIGEFNLQAKTGDGGAYSAVLEVYGASHRVRLEAAAEALRAGRAKVLGVTESEQRCGKPWVYEDVVAEASLRLRLGIEPAADALQLAYEEGLVSYPRSRSTEFSKDAVEAALALARQNRTAVDGSILPVESVRRGAHEAPRPIDDELQLGAPLSVMSSAEAVAVLLARNMIACGQVVKRKSISLEVDGMQLVLAEKTSPPLRCWKEKDLEPGFSALPLDYLLLRRVAEIGLGRASTSVDHVTRFVQRDLLTLGAEGWTLSEKGLAWAQHAEKAGMSGALSNEIESMIEQVSGTPYEMAREILDACGLKDQVLDAVRLGDGREMRLRRVDDNAI